MIRIPIKLSLLLAAALFGLTFAATPSVADPAQENEVTVQVKKNGEIIVTDVSFSVAATPQEAWAVLTDFDHMSSFISNLESSKIISRNGNVLQVEQKGKASRGMLSFSFESVREIELVPHLSIHTRQLSGSLKKLDGMTLLAAEGNGTRVTYHGESISNVWVPPMVGTGFIASEVREQFTEMRTEILKRKGAGAPK